MKEKRIQALKQLALIGALDREVSVSSSELGESMGVTQQAASQQILQLLKAGMIRRRMGVRRQQITITDTGRELLLGEHFDYLHLFDPDREYTIQGRVSSGFGEGGYYISKRQYVQQIQQTLGYVPYNGTLNLKIDPNDLGVIHLLRRRGGILLEGFEDDGRTFGPVHCFRCEIEGRECAIIIPERSHYRDTIEIIGEDRFRDVLELEDDDSVRLRLSMAP